MCNQSNRTGNKIALQFSKILLALIRYCTTASCKCLQESAHNNVDRMLTCVSQLRMRYGYMLTELKKNTSESRKQVHGLKTCAPSFTVASSSRINFVVLTLLLERKYSQYKNSCYRLPRLRPHALKRFRVPNSPCIPAPWRSQERGCLVMKGAENLDIGTK